MSKIITGWLVKQARPILPPKLAQLYRLPAQYTRPFSHTSRCRTDESIKTSPFQQPQAPPTPPSATAQNDLLTTPSLSLNRKANSAKNLSMTFDQMLKENKASRSAKNSSLYDTTFTSDGNFLSQTSAQAYVEPHHFHVYATKHNTHITVTDPKRNPIISLSCGNIGFRHSARKTYDAAFQLASFVMSRMQDRGINSQIKQLEVVLRGFGLGREAVTKALLGMEGKNIRHKIIKVADATRLKFGGARSKNPRRLG